MVDAGTANALVSLLSQMDSESANRLVLFPCPFIRITVLSLQSTGRSQPGQPGCADPHGGKVCGTLDSKSFL